MSEVRAPLSPGAFSITSMETEVADPSNKWLNFLVYGAHGAGKTTLLGSAVDVPQMQDVLVIMAEGGSVVFEDNPRIKEFKGLDVVRVQRMEQLQKLYEFLKLHCTLRDDPSKEEQLRNLQSKVFPGSEGSRLRKYRTVIVDSLSEVEAANLAKILNLDALGLDAGDDMEVAGFPQFRKNNHIMQRTVRQFRDLPIHVLMSCAQAFGQDERKAYHYSPKLTGQLSGIVQGFFDVVGWLVVGQKSRSEDIAGPRRLFVQPQSSPKADAKNRLAAYKSDFFEDPTMTTIMEGAGLIRKD